MLKFSLQKSLHVLLFDTCSNLTKVIQGFEEYFKKLK